MSGGPLIVELWIGGIAAANLRAYSARTGKEPQEILIELAQILDPEAGVNGRMRACANCGEPFYAKGAGHRYCQSPECKAQVNRNRQKRYRERSS